VSPIRVATADELPLLQELEIAAGAIFRDVGMPEVAGDEPLPLEELAAYQRAGHALVVVDDRGIMAYALVEPVDGCLHIEQISVHPRAARRGIGRRLIDHLATTTTMPALTLTTFLDVPWNAPYYQRCGFRIIDEITPGLARIRAHEAALGLDRWPRVCMRRDVGGPAKAGPPTGAELPSS
jgi:ribosomal protein S18 acetylase RimI-like enzyme